MNFEQSLKDLEEIIKKLEGNELSLEESVDAYKRGMELLMTCRSQLENAKLVIKNEADAD